VNEKVEIDPLTMKPLLVLYTDPLTGIVYNSDVSLEVLKNKCIIEYEHVEASAPQDALQTGFINSDTWNKGAQFTWMLRPPDAELLGQVGWRVTRRAEYDPATWQKAEYYRSRLTGVTPNDCHLNFARPNDNYNGNGIYLYRPKTMAFGPLNLPQVFK
jgi:hypothetical protein